MNYTLPNFEMEKINSRLSSGCVFEVKWWVVNWYPWLSVGKRRNRSLSHHHGRRRCLHMRRLIEQQIPGSLPSVHLKKAGWSVERVACLCLIRVTNITRRSITTPINCFAFSSDNSVLATGASKFGGCFVVVMPTPRNRTVCPLKCNKFSPVNLRSQHREARHHSWV
jgi:hypothetical protein